LSSLWASSYKEGRIKIYNFYPLNFYHAYNAKKKLSFIKPFWHALDMNNPHSRFLISRILRKEKPDIVHTHNLNGLSLGVVLAVKDLGFNLVHTCHDFSLLCPYATLTCSGKRNVFCEKPNFFCGIYRCLKKKVINDKPDYIIFPSKSTMQIYQENGFFLNTQTDIVPCCIEAAPKFEVDKTGLKTFDILYAGQLVYHKGVQILLDAFKALEYGFLRLHIVGDGEYKEELVRRAAGDKRVTFYGKVPNSQIGRFYSQADVTVVPSIWLEVLGIVILESLSSGTPVIGSDIGGIPEIIRDGFNGFVFKRGDSKSLAEILRKVVLDQGMLKKLRENSLVSAKVFMIDEHVLKLETIYQKVRKS
jgi:glycosyltransferase involved in cell wall biosynthesis